MGAQKFLNCGLLLSEAEFNPSKQSTIECLNPTLTGGAAYHMTWERKEVNKYGRLFWLQIIHTSK